MFIFFLVGAVAIFATKVGRNVSSSPESNNQATVLAAIDASKYVPLAPIPELGAAQSGNIGLRGYLQGLFKWGISIAVMLAVLMITYGGVLYMTTDAVTGKSEGKAKIWAAIAGLVLALSAWLILETIDPNITKTPTSSIITPTTTK